MEFLSYIQFKDLNSKQQDFFINEVNKILANNNIETNNISIDKIMFTTPEALKQKKHYCLIYLNNGLLLFSETDSPYWCKQVNEENIKIFYKNLIN